MASSPLFRSHGPDLLAHRDRVDIGLHFQLTGTSLEAWYGPSRRLALGNSVDGLLWRAIFGRLDLQEVERALREQLLQFEAVMGMPPRFVDGHHHIQQFPGIRNVVLRVLSDVYKGEAPYVRTCNDRFDLIIKRNASVLRALVIGFFGQRLAAIATRHGIAHNDGFSGVYDFSGAVPYEDLFERFTMGIRKNAIVMCHPGYVDEDLEKIDSLTAQRKTELDYFLSDAFLELLDRRRLSIGQFQ